MNSPEIYTNIGAILLGLLVRLNFSLAAKLRIFIRNALKRLEVWLLSNQYLGLDGFSTELTRVSYVHLLKSVDSYRSSEQGVSEVIG